MFALPRLLLAGLHGGAGKTILSLGVCRAWVEAGRRIRPFKKGPDYIDAAWLGLAAKAAASNLDPFLMPKASLESLFQDRAKGFDAAVVEGNRGLFDGKDLEGTCSTSELARQLKLPLVLILDATKMTRTAAAIVHGCATFEPGLNLAGVVLNRTATPRHRKILRESIEHYTGIPVLGSLPKIKHDPIPERHMGLLSSREYAGGEEILASLAEIARDYLDLPRLWEIACSAPDLPQAAPLWSPASLESTRPRIGYVRDAALWFYYDENLEALSQAGAELVELSLLDDAAWPEIHGLYLGGGFPETQAQALAENEIVRERVKRLSRAGLPIYAECGGFMYLCESLVLGEKTYPMAGVFPLSTTLCPKPQGLGYAQAKVCLPNIFHPQGATLSGHEFHYSRCLAEPAPRPDAAKLRFALEMTRGCGMLGGHDGLLQDNTFAAYLHIHALGAPHWAVNFLSAARTRALDTANHE